MSALPPAAANLLGFARLLRSCGFTVAPEQAISFMEGVALLGPRSMDDIREAALALLAPPADRRMDFESLFRAYFWGDVVYVAQGETDEATRVKDDGEAREQLAVESLPEKGGARASTAERLSARAFARDEDRLAAFRRELPAALPARRSFRNVRTLTGGKLDLRRSLRAIVGADGDVPSPCLRRRPLVQRRLLMLIDVSGSMKLHTTDYLKLAHAVVHAADRAEIFAFGTRLTRLTPSLSLRDRDAALARVAELVEDWDGGTRIGPTLAAFLAVPRFAAFARGAAVVILSDGLERGGHAEMEAALRRLSARAHRLSFCTPLAGDPRFRPETGALKAVLPLLDDLVDGSSIAALTRFILSLARPAAAASKIWRKVS
jgi:uncharacterized protein with von Willebrand factor type A (vWA) domain